MKRAAVSADAIDDDFALKKPLLRSDSKQEASGQAEESQDRPAKEKKNHKEIIAAKKKLRAGADTTTTSSRVVLSSLSHQAQVDYMNGATKKTFQNWTEIELASHAFQGSHIMNPAHLDFTAAHDLPNLNQFVKAALPDWQQCLSVSYNQQTGQPTLLILTISGQRAADIIRALPDANKACRVMKLFAKHFKVSEQADYLSRNIVRVAVGTPHRMSQLATQEALDLSAARALILDVFRDQKERNIFEYQDIAKELLEFIHSHCFPYLASNSMQIVWY